MTSSRDSINYFKRLKQFNEGANSIAPGRALECPRGDTFSGADFEPHSILVVQSGWAIGQAVDNSVSNTLNYAIAGDVLWHPYRSHQDGTFGRWVAVEDMSCLLIQAIPQSQTILEFILDFEILKKTIIQDRLFASTYGNTETKVALFILQTLDWLKAVNSNYYDRFRCPMSQQQMGEMLGTTNIHVSRILAALFSKGLIKRHQSFIEVTDRTGLERICSYRNQCVT